VHPESATAQLGLTPEEAVEIHKESIRAQEEIQEEIKEEDWVRRDRVAKVDAHPDETKRVPTTSPYIGPPTPPDPLPTSPQVVQPPGS
jgi:hypothetical protein